MDDWDDESDIDDEYDADNTDDEDADEPTVACPYCRRQIHEDAQRCPYCEQYISDEDAPARPRPWWIVVGVMLCLAIVAWWVVASR